MSQIEKRDSSYVKEWCYRIKRSKVLEVVGKDPHNLSWCVFVLWVHRLRSFSFRVVPRSSYEDITLETGPVRF